MKPLPVPEIQRIVIRAANWVGDALMSTPAIHGIRRRFPHARITILAKPWVAPLFEHNPDLDRIMIYAADGRHRKPLGLLPLSRDLRRERFDLAVLIQNAFEAALITAMARIPHRLGYSADGRTPLLTHPVPRTRAMLRRHQIDYYLGILEGAGIPAQGRRMVLALSPEERYDAEARLAATGHGDGCLIGINPGAAFGTAKRWPAGRFAALCRRLQEIRPGARFAIFGSPSEEALGDAIASAIGSAAVNFCGQTTLRQALALIDRCRLLVTNDSGLMHAAAALRIPQVAIFGPTHHTTTFPSSPESRMVRLPVPCAPCMQPHCPLGHHRCMRGIGVDRVLDAALRVMGRSPA